LSSISSSAVARFFTSVDGWPANAPHSNRKPSLAPARNSVGSWSRAGGGWSAASASSRLTGHSAI
jgi:hypothetical protein